MFKQSLLASSLVVAAAAAVLPGSAQANTVTSIPIESTGVSTEDLGLFTGTIAFGANAFGGSADLSITLTNTSPAANGGYITGFVFNIADDPDSSVSAQYKPGTDDPFEGLVDASASPYGTFEFGASLSDSWLGSGKPGPGIYAGETRTFLFELSGDKETTGNLSASSFLTTNLPGGTTYPFAVRFRGFDDDGSDKVIGGTPTTPPQVVPLPAAAWGGLALLGLLGVGKQRLRRRVEAGAIE